MIYLYNYNYNTNVKIIKGAKLFFYQKCYGAVI